MSNSLVENLNKAGLSDKAALVYAAILELGGAYPSKIAQITKLNRTTVYALLLDLSIKGLVHEIEKGKKLYYQVDKPAKLLTHAENQVKIAENNFDQVKKILPFLENIHHAQPNKPKVLFFEGKDAPVSVMDDHIAVTEPYEMLVLANASGLIKHIPLKYYSDYRKVKEKVGITTRGIITDRDNDIDFIKSVYGNIKKEFWPVVRSVPADQFPFVGEIVIYGKDKVSIVNYEGKKPIGIIIEDLTIYSMMKMMFEMSWKAAQK